MDQKIDELVQSIKQEEVYQVFVEKEKALQTPQIQILLHKYQDCLHEYDRMKTYEKYAPIDECRQALQECKIEMSENKIIQEYYQAYYALRDHLDEITKLVFFDISELLDTSPFVI